MLALPAQRLRRFVPSGRLLDVGADIGEFLHHADRFFEVMGTEVSEEAIRLGRAISELRYGKGNSPKRPNLNPGTFDIVSLVRVLELGKTMRVLSFH